MANMLCVDRKMTASGITGKEKSLSQTLPFEHSRECVQERRGRALNQVVSLEQIAWRQSLEQGEELV